MGRSKRGSGWDAAGAAAEERAATAAACRNSRRVSMPPLYRPFSRRGGAEARRKARSYNAAMKRRTVLQAAPLFLRSDLVFGSQANSTIELGLIGCGSRGNWIAPLFTEYAPTRWVAVADVVASKLESTRAKLGVAQGRAYHGPDAYRELAHSALDAVVIETPTYYHPAQAAAGVDAGKHVYCAKPIAVDVPGSKDFLAAGERAQSKGLSFWVDFQSRARPVFQELVDRI